MKKKIALTVIGSTLIGLLILSFIEIDYINEVNNKNELYYSINIKNKDFKKVSNLELREKDIIVATSRGLVKKNLNGKIEEDLIDKYEIKDKGIEYTFYLKEDIYWSDGSKINVEDIYNYFRYIIKYEDKDEIEALLNVYGAKEYRNGTKSFEEGVAIYTNKNKITFRFNKKEENFIEELTKPIYRIRKDIELWNDIFKNYKEIRYSGDYIIDNMNDTVIELDKKKYNSNGVVNGITLVKDLNEETSMAAFEVGERDIIVDPPESQLNRLSSEGKLNTLPANRAKYIDINSKKNTTVQERKYIYKLMYGSIHSYSKENPNLIDVTENSYFREDKEQIEKLQRRKVLTDSAKGNNKEILTILAVDKAENRKLCQYIVNWFKINTNITIRYTLVNKEDYKNIAIRDRYDVSIIEVEDTSIDRIHLYEQIKEWFEPNEMKVFNRLKNTGSQKFEELENTLFTNYTVLPLIFFNKSVAISSNVKEVAFDYYGNIDFSTIKN